MSDAKENGYYLNHCPFDDSCSWNNLQTKNAAKLRRSKKEKA
jgi:hypothetical protein